MNIKGQCHSQKRKQKKNKKKNKTKPIEALFQVDPTWDGIMKASINGLCHMTQMVAMPIYTKKLSKSSSLEPKDRWT